MFALSKTFTFEAAHRLQNHSGKCRNVHGHSYKVEVNVTGLNLVDDEGGSEEGMLFDFGVLKEWWKPVESTFDHRIILQEGDPLVDALSKHTSMTLFPWPPTAENMAEWLRDDLSNWLVKHLGVDRFQSVMVKVWETDNSYAVSL